MSESKSFTIKVDAHSLTSPCRPDKPHSIKYRSKAIQITSTNNKYYALCDNKTSYPWKTIKEAAQDVLTKVAGIQVNITSIRSN